MTGIRLAAVMLVFGLAGCSSTASPSTSPARHPTTAKATTPSLPAFDVTEFSPSGSSIAVSLQVTNTTGREFRWVDKDLVVVDPSGSRHVDSRVGAKGFAGYGLIPAGEITLIADVFPLSTFKPGRYEIWYGGHRIASKNL